MSKAKFTYDESGATFFYFVLSFLALILIPSTYYFWPEETNDIRSKVDCRCNGCQNKKRYMKDAHKWKKSRRRMIRALIALGWSIFVAIAYKCATAQHEYINWDPFEILGVREDASPNDIKKAYRQLSLIYHPDKDTGDSDRFVKITKAYAALTDDEARKNWEMYGNPDGPGATSFGIALPSWIVEKENSFVVLGIYALIFMVALPVSVGIWWYRSVKFGNDKVLLTTTELYYFFIHKTPNMALKRVIMILAASFEFAKSHNPEVIERPTDNQEVPRLIRDLPLLGEKNKERPLCYSYSVKTRAILHAHLGRMKLPASTLELDRCFIVQKCPYLIQEFVQCISQLITLALSGRINVMPNLVTLENAMKLGPLVVQALWEYNSPLLQLPHFTEDTLRQFERRKIKVRTNEQLARMKDSEKRDILRNFTPAQIDDILFVLGSMPMIQVDCKFEVLDDEDPGIITAGSIVTAIVNLKRKQLKDLFEKTDNSRTDLDVTDRTAKADDQELNSCTEPEDISDPNNDGDRSINEKENIVAGEGSKVKSTDSLKSKIPESNDHDTQAINKLSSDEEEEDWERKFQEKVIKKQKVFESKSKKSHSVHCPYYPEDKQEYWWVYIVDRKRFALITAPLLVTSLVDSEEIELKFSVPRAGLYAYTIVVRSDSYVDCVMQKQTRFEVKPAKEYIEPVYDIPDDDDEPEVDEEHSSVEDSDLLTDTDDD